MSLSPGVEYAKQEIQRRIEAVGGELRSRQVTATIEFLAEHIEEIHTKLEQQRNKNLEMEERIRQLENRISEQENTVYRRSC